MFLTDGTNIGIVKDILQPGANDVYVVKDGKKEHLIPAIKDVIKEVNLEEKRMVIDPLEGTLE